MMRWDRSGIAVAGCLAVLATLGTEARGQATTSSGSSSSGSSVAISPYAGLAPIWPGSVRATGTPGTSTGGIQGTQAFDPVAMGMMYGMPYPVTRTQGTMYMMSMGQRMTGLGNGQISGVRPLPGAAGDASRGGKGVGESPRVAAHTANTNIPGGQASRFFNRTTARATHPQQYYSRRERHFPQTAH